MKVVDIAEETFRELGEPVQSLFQLSLHGYVIILED